MKVQVSTMTRPLLNCSIVELQAAYAKAYKNQNFEKLGALEYELSHRKTQKARELLGNVQASLKSNIKRGQASFDFNHARQKHSSSSASKSKSKLKEVKSRPIKLKQSSNRKPTYKPTQEQQIAIDAFLTGGSLKINAYAGTGKTSTLQLLANATRSRGQYLAFNKSIVSEARDKFPESVNCSTMHGLALKAIPREYRTTRKKCFGVVNANQLCKLIGIE